MVINIALKIPLAWMLSKTLCLKLLLKNPNKPF